MINSYLNDINASKTCTDVRVEMIQFHTSIGYMDWWDWWDQERKWGVDRGEERQPAMGSGTITLRALKPCGS